MGGLHGACRNVSFQLKVYSFVYKMHFHLSVVSLKGERRP